MDDDSEIIIESKEEKRELLLSKTILLLTKKDKLSIKLPAKGNNWLLKFYFTDDDDKDALNCNSNVNKAGELELFFNKWYSTSWVENIEPFSFISEDKKLDILVKVRISAEQSNDLRQLFISVWRKI